MEEGRLLPSRKAPKPTGARGGGTQEARKPGSGAGAVGCVQGRSARAGSCLPTFPESAASHREFAERGLNSDGGPRQGRKGRQGRRAGEVVECQGSSPRRKRRKGSPTLQRGFERGCEARLATVSRRVALGVHCVLCGLTVFFVIQGKPMQSPGMWGRIGVPCSRSHIPGGSGSLLWI